jgi:hypothetical protein
LIQYIYKGRKVNNIIKYLCNSNGEEKWQSPEIYMHQTVDKEGVVLWPWSGGEGLPYKTGVTHVQKQK